MPDRISLDTRERLLAAAERLLLTRPYEEVSVRGVCTESGANPAAVHYHFGSKDALVGALLEDRLGPLWAERLGAVTARRVEVPAIVDAVIAPFVDLAGDPIGRLHLRLLAGFVLGRHATTWRQPWFRMDSWVPLLPELSKSESRRRWQLAFDLIIARFGSAEQRALPEQAVESLKTFVIAGLTAPEQR
ncbi:TetR/AcrR family transcriptional regulator [Nocardia crassostreae]|uniref:TetR/AcrR family transcriptional regulator n=1 Tax=Nocardia crassostreae TaxID=53428 RepID=UPI0008361197|nr:TetR/AcrR family transcriptional regulator [Nocardia crassostreae]